MLSGAIDIEKEMQRSLVEFKDFLTGEAGGSWDESEIIVTWPIPWSLAQLLRSRLRAYDFVLVYFCASESAGTLPEYSESLREVADVFIKGEGSETVSLEELGYERA